MNHEPIEGVIGGGGSALAFTSSFALAFASSFAWDFHLEIEKKVLVLISDQVAITPAHG